MLGTGDEWQILKLLAADKKTVQVTPANKTKT